MSEGIATLIAMIIVLVFVVIPVVFVWIYQDRQNTKILDEHWKKITDEIEQIVDGKPMDRKFVESVVSVKSRPSPSVSGKDI